jgi:hypothetical protein
VLITALPSDSLLYWLTPTACSLRESAAPFTGAAYLKKRENSHAWHGEAMIKKISMATICLFGTVIAGNANAHDAKAGWQIGASAVTSELNRDDKIVDGSSIGFKLHAQYKFNSWLGLEGAYYYSGDFSSDASSAGGDKVQLVYKGVIIQGIGYIPLPWDEVQLFVKGGYFDSRVDSTINGANAGTGSDDGSVFGTGLSIHVTESFHFRTEFDWFNTNKADLWTVGLGLEYHF